MISVTPLRRLALFAIPAAFVVGIAVSATVGWYAATASGPEAGWRVFVLLGLITVIMTLLLAWSLRLAAREAARAEAALEKARAAAERFRELLELSSDWYWEQDAAFRFTAMSGGVVNKGGFAVEQALGKTRWELPIEGLDDAAWAAHRAALERHEPFHDLRYRIRIADGSLRHYSVNGRPFFAADGTFLGYRGVGRDISAEVAAAEALQSSERQLLKAQEVAHLGSWTLDIPANRLAWSEETYRLFGLAPGTPLDYGTFMERVHPADRDKLNSAWQAALAGQPYDIEHRIVVDGAVRWVRECAEVDFDSAGRPLAGVGTVQDITAQKEAELRLRLAASVFGHSLEGITLTDAGKNIISVNRAFTRITGYTAQEVLGRNPRLLQSGRHDAAFYAALWRDIEEKGSWSGEIWNRRKNGEIYPEWISIVAVRDEAGLPLHYLAVFSDISERHRAEEQIRQLNEGLERRVAERTAELEAANRELEAFSYSVSHDLRAPLRGIDGFAHILAEDYASRLDETGRAHLERIRRASQRLSQTIDDLLELARITRTPLHRREVDLSALARAVMLELSQHSRHRPTVVIAESVAAQADPALLRSMLEKLLDNAWKFTSGLPAPRIEFGVSEAGGERAYFVRDNGAGFDPAFAGKLFQPFQRLHPPDAFAGSGIGLATVARIVKRYGGRVWAEGAPDKGATFWFTLQ